MLRDRDVFKIKIKIKKDTNRPFINYLQKQMSYVPKIGTNIPIGFVQDVNVKKSNKY